MAPIISADVAGAARPIQRPRLYPDV